MKKYILFLLAFVSLNSFASSFNTEKEIRSYSDKLMQQVLKEDFDNAFNTVKPYWPMPAVEIDGIVNQIKLQWPIVNQRFGKPIGIEFIREERIGKSFLRYYYLHKFENHAIYWHLDFYKPVNVWKINGVNFLDTLDAIYK